MTARTPRAPVDERLALERGHHAEPHRILGAHPAPGGAVVRAFHPDATSAEVVRGDVTVPLAREGDGGLFSGVVPGLAPGMPYRLRLTFPDGNRWEIDDPYRFLPTLGDVDVHLFAEGTHRRPDDALGARCHEQQGVEGVAFATWAPNARAVHVAGDFNGWSARALPMRRIGQSGIFELFVPFAREGNHYKLHVHGADGVVRVKADPWARWSDRPPGTASRVFRSRHAWSDGPWMEARARKDWPREPVSMLEVHLGSFARGEGGRILGARELAPLLVEHATRLGFTHVELMPIMEHPFDPSWGYQVSGYHAPTARLGTPDDVRALVDALHGAGVGVILDWVPGHFVRDEWALARFDGTALFEHEDDRRGLHPDWGTAVFNLGRREVRSFLIGNALYWLEEFHADGLRVDAVASMLYLDYSRKPGEWIPNVHGGREDLDAVSFLQELNDAVRTRCPGAFTVAEESTAWPGVTAPTAWGGLGFTFKWNLGWMHDTLAYFARDPVHRPYHHDQLTFALIYEHSERFVNALSHDEVVHGKGSLLGRMPGDDWQRFANLRALLAYQWTRPGKELLFMGTDLAPEGEWRSEESLPWHLAADPRRQGLATLLADLNGLARGRACFFRGDPDPGGFAWIDCHDRDHSVLAYARWHGEDHALVVLNLTPVPRTGWRLGTPRGHDYVVALDTDAARYGGSGFRRHDRLAADGPTWQGQPCSLVIDLPPLSAVVLVPAS